MTTNTIKPTILFKRPETIAGTVKFPLPDGTEAKLACQFKYRTRKEFGALWDEIAQASLTAASEAAGAPKPAKSRAAKGKAAAPTPVATAPTPAEFTFEGMMANGDEANAKNALRYLVNWPEELPALNVENLIQIFDEAPAAAPAFWNTYRNLCTTGVAGN